MPERNVEKDIALNLNFVAIENDKIHLGYLQSLDPQNEKDAKEIERLNNFPLTDSMILISGHHSDRAPDDILIREETGWGAMMVEHKGQKLACCELTQREFEQIKRYAKITIVDNDEDKGKELDKLVLDTRQFLAGEEKKQRTNQRIKDSGITPEEDRTGKTK